MVVWVDNFTWMGSRDSDEGSADKNTEERGGGGGNR